MNDDPSATTSHSADSSNHVVSPPWGDDRDRSDEDGSPAVSQEREKSFRAHQLETRTKLLEKLMTSFDTVFHAELAAMYYMDNSFLQLFVRGMIHYYGFILLTAHHKHLPYYGLIIASNCLCALIHIGNARPEAGEATRGYLHGGLLIDFVGQKGPISKLHLVLLDGFLLLLQLLMLAVFVELHKIKTMRLKQGTSATVQVGGNNYTAGQDHDAEERGVHRLDTGHGDDIELQDLQVGDNGDPLSVNGTLAQRADEQGAALVNDSLETGFSYSGHSFYSGRTSVAELDVVGTIRYLVSRSTTGANG